MISSQKGVRGGRDLGGEAVYLFMNRENVSKEELLVE